MGAPQMEFRVGLKDFIERFMGTCRVKWNNGERNERKSK